MNNNNSKLLKSSSVFIAAVLVAGVIAIASPSIAFAQEFDGNEKKYDKKYSYDPYKPDKKYSYDPYKPDKKYSYDPYKPDKKDGKPGWNTHKAVCKVGNVYINSFEQFQGSFENELAGLVSEATTQTPEEGNNGPDGGMNGFNEDGNSGGDPSIDISNNVLNICANFFNENDPTVDQATQNQNVP